MKTDSIMLAENGWVPNNARLPVIIYSAALDSDELSLVDRFEALFGAHGWPADWRDAISTIIIITRLNTRCSAHFPVRQPWEWVDRKVAGSRYQPAMR